MARGRRGVRVIVHPGKRHVHVVTIGAFDGAPAFTQRVVVGDRMPVGFGEIVLHIFD